FARRAAVHEGNGKPALGEMQPDRGTDNAGTEHDGIDARHGVPFQTLRRPRARGRPELADCYHLPYGRAMACRQARSAHLSAPARVAPPRQAVLGERTGTEGTMVHRY